MTKVNSKMAGLSRAEKLGTIFTRVRNLIRAGVIKEEKKPVWYDVMKAFPPIDEPHFHRKIDRRPLRQLLYPEDKIRAKFYQIYGSQRAIDLNDHGSVKNTPCHRFIQKYQELENSKSDVSEEELMQLTADSLQEEGLILRKKRQFRSEADGVQLSERDDRRRQSQPISHPKISSMIQKAIDMAEKAEQQSDRFTLPMDDDRPLQKINLSEIMDEENKS
ncbi:small ribosomal subunit protein mS23-like [Ptychodera flava]|uniref:small ribosomal subunit protein mS23-like n=1 Tax=Ptychodera flava TaxID=63121 RepID=UPI00396A5EFC